MEKAEKKKYYCPNCGEEKSKKSSQCIKCNNIGKRKIINRPEKEILLKEIEESGYVRTGKKYGVSDNAIRKWLK